MTNVKQNVGGNLRRLRGARGWTLRDVEQRLDKQGTPLGFTSLSRIETAKQGVKIEDLDALRRVFGVSADELMGDPSALDDAAAAAAGDRYIDALRRRSVIVQSLDREVDQARSALEDLDADAVRRYVHSNPRLSMAAALLDPLFFASYFQAEGD